MNEQILRGIRFFTREKQIMAGLAVACGTADALYTALDGCRDLQGTPLTGDTLCDLASATKLFTGMAALRLLERGELDLHRPVTDYAPAFAGLSGVCLEDLLCFRTALNTPERIDAQPDREAAMRQLLAMRAAPAAGPRFYSDMHAMVLGAVLEGISGMPLFGLIRELILAPLDMRDTFAAVPPELRGRCACYDREHRIEGGAYILREGIRPGMPHDPKARILSPDGMHLCGHAGLFSTLTDMTKFCRGVLTSRVLRPDTLAFMARNRTGARLPGGGWTQFLGCMCYVRHPEQYYSEVPVYMGRRAVAMGGFTGNHVSLDPETGRWAVFLGNRVLNRLTVAVLPEGIRRESLGLAPDGTGSVRWPDGRQVYSSVDYVHLKDRHLHAAIMAAAGWEPFHADFSREAAT